MKAITHFRNVPGIIFVLISSTFSLAAQSDQSKVIDSLKTELSYRQKLDSLQLEISRLEKQNYSSKQFKLTEKQVKRRYVGGIIGGGIMTVLGGISLLLIEDSDIFSVGFYITNGIGLIIPGAILLISNSAKLGKLNMAKKKYNLSPGVTPNGIGMVMTF